LNINTQLSKDQSRKNVHTHTPINTHTSPYIGLPVRNLQVAKFSFVKGLKVKIMSL